MTDRFLSRWSRRKAATRPASVMSAPKVEHELPTIVPERPEAVEAEEPVVADIAEAEEPVEVAEEDIDEAELEKQAAELGLPSLDSLGPGSDFKAFMQSHVPARLRTLALRKLWGSNPVLANLDGLIDYGEDFTDKALAVANLQTAYQVGRGYNTDPDPEEIEDEDLEVVEDELDAADTDEIADADTAEDETSSEEEVAANDTTEEEDETAQTSQETGNASEEIDGETVNKKSQRA